MKRPAVWLAVVLFSFSFLVISYRILWLGYPFLPTVPGKAWQLSMEAHVTADKDQEITVRIGLPDNQAGRIVTEERITSGSLTFNLLREGPNQMGVWSGRGGPGGNSISYRSTILVNLQPASKPLPPKIESYPLSVGKTEQDLARRLAARWSPLEPSARLQAVAGTVAGVWGTPAPEETDIEAWKRMEETSGRLTAFLVLLRAAGLPARMVQGLPLAECVTDTPVTWVEVWTGQGWKNVRPENGEVYSDSISFLPLATRGLPAVQVSRGEVTEIRWTLDRQTMNRWRHHFERIVRSGGLLDRWSLFRLPQDYQETFRILILVPVGALMICVLRNLVGFPTFGVFMPVLMAIAFRSTGLVYGLSIFGGVVIIGYGVRRWIDRLRLLLVPRLSVILTFVIIVFTALALIGNKLDLRQFMAVGLLPFVILTMTVERFYIIIEEAGVREGLKTAAGSAAVAVITYELLHLDFLQLTFFVYPELLFTVAGLQILLGRYTGYRLSELLRFRAFRRPS
jgi:hypothetical protein